ncbi:MAG: tRNA (adenosine(37)-N6)-threonylcarbamoyltransferase complex dimerization subunit type 1 TsaB [Calditrichota bacterium]
MILCLDASTDKTVIGLRLNDDLTMEHVLTERDRLAFTVAELLDQWRVWKAELRGIAVGIGPGSFTGLRVSLAFAKGFARGLAIPIYPISSLKVMAANYGGAKAQVAVISPARRGEAHLAIFSTADLAPMQPNRVVAHEQLPELIAPECALTGPGLSKLGEALRLQLADAIPSEAIPDYPQVIHLGQLALNEWQDRTPPDIGIIVPDYGLDFPVKV